MNKKLFEYININDLPSIKEMVKSGFRIDKDLQEALSYASHNTRLEIVKYLVESGADIQAYENHALRGAALMKSANYGNLEVIEYLVSKGADVKAIQDTKHPIIKEWIDNYLSKSKNKLK